MSERKKETFVLDKKEGKETKKVEFAVLSPLPENGRKAQAVYNSVFSEALANKGLLRRRLNGYMKDQGLWDDKKEDQQRELASELNAMELKIQKGGIKLTEARKIALDMRVLRIKLRDLIAAKNELDQNTAEGQAENARFNCLVSQCLVYNDTGKPVYSDMDEYLKNGDQEEAWRGAQELAGMLYQLDKNFDANLPENKFLQTWKFVDEELRLINKDKELVDLDGKLINEDGHFIDAEGSLIDRKGNPVDEDGNYSVEGSPFLDDDGAELVSPEEEEKSDAEAVAPASD